MRAISVAGIGIAVFIELLLVSKKNKSFYDIVCGSAVIYEWRASMPTGLPDSRQNQ